MASNIYRTIYTKLVQLIGDPKTLPPCKRGQTEGNMDLYVEQLLVGGEVTMVSLVHYIDIESEEDDPVPNPLLEVKVYPARQEAEVVNYQDQATFLTVYPAPGKIDKTVVQELNAYLDQWLGTLLERGYVFVEVDCDRR